MQTVYFYLVGDITLKLIFGAICFLLPGEYERMVEAYSLVNQKLQDSVSEQSNMEKFIMELKVLGTIKVAV